LHKACEGGHVGVAAALISRDADVNVQDVEGQTPLHLACRSDNVLLVRLLLKHSAATDETDCHGRTALMVAGVGSGWLLQAHMDAMQKAESAIAESAIAESAVDAEDPLRDSSAPLRDSARAGAGPTPLELQ